MNRLVAYPASAVVERASRERAVDGGAMSMWRSESQGCGQRCAFMSYKRLASHMLHVVVEHGRSSDCVVASESCSNFQVSRAVTSELAMSKAPAKRDFSSWYVLLREPSTATKWYSQTVKDYFLSKQSRTSIVQREGTVLSLLLCVLLNMWMSVSIIGSTKILCSR